MPKRLATGNIRLGRFFVAKILKARRQAPSLAQSATMR